MRAIAIVLILGVFIAHDAANWLAEGTRFSPAAVFYMLQGAWSAALSACLLLLIWVGVASSIWRSIAIVALVVSIIEGLLMPVCRLAITDISLVRRGVNLCDHVTGLPIGAVILTLEVLALFWIIGVWFRAKDAT